MAESRDIWWVLIAYRRWLGPPVALLLVALALRVFGLGLEEVLALLDGLR